MVSSKQENGSLAATRLNRPGWVYVETTASKILFQHAVSTNPSQAASTRGLTTFRDLSASAGHPFAVGGVFAVPVSIHASVGCGQPWGDGDPAETPSRTSVSTSKPSIPASGVPLTSLIQTATAGSQAKDPPINRRPASTSKISASLDLSKLTATGASVVLSSSPEAGVAAYFFLSAQWRRR
jgi:hypothetical protein